MNICKDLLKCPEIFEDHQDCIDINSRGILICVGGDCQYRKDMCCFSCRNKLCTAREKRILKKGDRKKIKQIIMMRRLSSVV